MKIALVAPSGVPFVVGGAEKLWWGLTHYVNQHTGHALELIKLPSPERNFWEIVRSYEQFSTLDLLHFDAVISTKYPAWMVDHPNHVVYLQHKLRGLYDTYPSAMSLQPPKQGAAMQALWNILQGPSCDRQLLPELFGRIRELQHNRHLDQERLNEITALPGPLIRAVVHKLDAIALRPQAISKFFAISRVVAERRDYFPPKVPVEVLPHPSNLEGLHEGPSEFVFTASRLDAPKRIDLIVGAYRRCRTDVPLWIAGDGPEEGRLRALADGDPRIRFLGRLTDQELVDHYSRAALVPFVPHLEDMGLITLEAMESGKPVLTVTDAGGVTEFVQDGVNGRIVAPNEKALAQAMEDMLADPVRLQSMGQAALQSAAQVTWQRTALALLHAAAAKLDSGAAEATLPAHTKSTDLPRRPHTSDRLRLLVVNTFGIFPPDSGGKKRVFYLYRSLAEKVDVTLLNLGPADSPPEIRHFGSHFREIRVGPSARFNKSEAVLGQQLHRPVTDIAALLYSSQLYEFRKAFAHLALDTDVVVASHVYFGPMIEALWHGPVWYDAHNVEADMKADVLGLPRITGPVVTTPWPAFDVHGPDAGHWAVQHVAVAEARLVQRAAHVWAVSEANQQRLASLYGRETSTVDVVPNGTHLPADAWLDAPRRAQLKSRLGFGAAPVALFVASYHGPNLEAMDSVLEAAKLCPNWYFVVAGSICSHLQSRALPGNVLATGVIAEAELTALLRAADVGMNPMRTGSGTNLKMLDYAGHGALILTTPEGARGLAFVAGQHHIECEIADFPGVLNQLTDQVPAPYPEVRAAARDLAEKKYAWNAVASALVS